jgi:hypothetical protein
MRDFHFVPVFLTPTRICGTWETGAGRRCRKQQLIRRNCVPANRSRHTATLRTDLDGHGVTFYRAVR